MKELEICLAALGIGLSLGSLGAGGSILTIPVFVYILKKDPVSSGVYSMFVVGTSSLVGSIKSLADKLVDFRILLAFGIPSVTGVFIAREFIFPCIPDQLFSIGSFTMSKSIFFMLSISALMLLSAVKILSPAGKIIQEPGFGMPSMVLLVVRGLFVGILTGLLGVGAGFLIVPALYILALLPLKKAIGTALLIIAVNSLFGFLKSYASVDLDWLLLVKFSLGSIPGILIGRKLAAKMRGEYLKKIFGWFILFMSFYIGCRQFLV